MNSKSNITKAKLIKLLRDNKWEKTAVADVLRVGEATVRRLCKKLNIDVEYEKNKQLEDLEIVKTVSKAKTSINKAKIDRWVAISDTHDKDVSWPSLKAICDFIKDFKPKYVIQIGDLLDYTCLMGMGKRKYPAFDGQDFKQLEDAFEVGQRILDLIATAAPKDAELVYEYGNHEYRAIELIARCPEFKKLLDPEECMDLSRWKVLPYLKSFKIGKLNIFHGEFFGQNHVQKHLKHYQKNILYGHTHGIQQDTMASPMREIPIWGAAMGCVCNVNPDYQRNKSNQWQHGFAYGYVDQASGDFDQQLKRIIHNKFWAEGVRYGV